MGYTTYCAGYGPRTVAEYRAELIADFVDGITILAHSTTSDAFYFAMQTVADARAATIWDVAEGETYVTCGTCKYNKPTSREGFGHGNLWDETGGPNNAEPAKKVWKLLTPLRPLTDAEIAHKDAMNDPNTGWVSAPEGVREQLVWAHNWRERVAAGYRAQEVIRQIKPGVTFRTPRTLSFQTFEADTFTATMYGGKVRYIAKDTGGTVVRLNKGHLIGSEIIA